MFAATETGFILWVLLILDVLAIAALLLGHGSTRHKLIWTAVILLLPLVGLFAFLIWGHSRADEPLV